MSHESGPIPASLRGSREQEHTFRNLRRLLEGSPDAAVILDSERRILYFNPVYQQYAGLRGRQLHLATIEGKHCYEVFCLEICENACLGLRAQQVGRPLRVDEIAGRRGDGEELKLIVNAVPMEGDFIVETYRDVTADARVQSKYKVLLDHERRTKEILEQTVQERTEELRQANVELSRTHGQLILQEKMSSLGRLVAGIAHELNNPINFVYGNVDFLGSYVEDLFELIRTYDGVAHQLNESARQKIAERKEAIEFEFLAEDCKKLLRSIQSGAERTAQIVRDLKAFSRQGGAGLQEADLAQGIDTTLNLIGPILKNRINVVRDLEGLPLVLCHAGHVNQVMMNILTNAAQAIKGEGRIDVVARQHVLEGGVPGICIRVTDSGPGIPPDILPNIFDPFFTTKAPGEGTGLGLAISQRIVRQHGGRLYCVSPPGEGATFIVELPLAPPETSEAARAAVVDSEVRRP